MKISGITWVRKDQAVEIQLPLQYILDLNGFSLHIQLFKPTLSALSQNPHQTPITEYLHLELFINPSPTSCQYDTLLGLRST